MDFTGDAVMARFGFALGWQPASMPKLMGWGKGDEFEAARGKEHKLKSFREPIFTADKRLVRFHIGL